VLAGSVDIATAEYPIDAVAEHEWFTLRAAAVDVDGERWAVVAHEDVTTLRLAVDRWHSTFSNAAVPTFLADRAGTVLDANAAFAELLRVDLATTIGRPAAGVVHPDDRDMLHALLRQAASGDGTPCELRLAPADGATAVVRAHPSSIVHGHDAGVVVQLVDLTSQRRAEARLALHLELLELVAAGTPLTEVATAVAANIGRAIDQATGAVLLAGQPPALSPDLQTPWLPLVGSLERTPVDVTTFPYRAAWSVAVPDLGTPKAAIAVLTVHDRAPAEDDEHSAQLLASVVRLALQRDAMVTAQADVTTLQEPSSAAADDLRRALTAGEVGVHYQPIVDLRSGETVSLEALVRWEHPTRGFVPPPELIQVAETSGLIGAIGTLVLTTACRDLAVCRAAGAAALSVAVNLSARQLADPDLVPLVRRALVDAGLEPSSLVVEITESVVVDDVDQVAGALSELRRLGVRVAIDDFGTGYSSLLYLKRFPADELKVDRSFVQGLGVNDGDTAIVDAVVELGHRLGLVVVAEGVETSQQLHELRRRRCDRAQGFLLQRPVPAAELSRFLDAGAVDLGPEPAESHIVPGELEVDQLLSHLIDELSRLSHALGRPSPTTSVDLTRFVAQTTDDLGPLLAHHDVHRFFAPGPIPVDVEPVAIRQILTNLLSNAVKFTEPGTRIDIAVARTDATATVAIIDHGLGVPPDRESELFGRFSRLGTTARGLGLGLHLSRSLARRQGGELVHERTGGGGATFVLELPA
jgi:PAS domain S-box-containing protein